MLKIWGRKNSTNVRKALWCAQEVAVPYEAIDAGGAFGLVDGPEYRAMNPNVRYLAARYAPNSALYPENLAARANADKWMDWTTSSLAEPFKSLFWGVVRTPAEQRDWVKIEAATQVCADILKVADTALAEQPYLSGDAFGMGDIPLGSFIYAWFEMPIQRPPLPHLQAWYERLKQRPAYRNAVMTTLS
jgi:glutathione S-transferase